MKDIRILIVDDNIVNQLLVRNMLKNFGFIECDCADNGRTALEKLRNKKFHLVLMDIQMPEMDGYQVTREIRTNMPPSICKIPIIALTADSSEKEKTQAREAGMNHYIVKPYVPEELFSAITSIIQVSGIKMPSSATINPETDQVFSIESLKKYTAGDNELAVQIIEIFLKQVQEAIRKFESLIPEGDWKHVHNVAHKLKGSIAIFEFDELKKILVAIEQYSDSKEKLTEIPVLFSKFKTISSSYVANLEMELKKIKRLKV